MEEQGRVPGRKPAHLLPQPSSPHRDAQPAPPPIPAMTRPPSLAPSTAIAPPLPSPPRIPLLLRPAAACPVAGIRVPRRRARRESASSTAWRHPLLHPHRQCFSPSDWGSSTSGPVGVRPTLEPAPRGDRFAFHGTAGRCSSLPSVGAHLRGAADRLRSYTHPVGGGHRAALGTSRLRDRRGVYTLRIVGARRIVCSASPGGAFASRSAATARSSSSSLRIPDLGVTLGLVSVFDAKRYAFLTRTRGSSPALDFDGTVSTLQVIPARAHPDSLHAGAVWFWSVSKRRALLGAHHLRRRAYQSAATGAPTAPMCDFISRVRPGAGWPGQSLPLFLPGT